MTHVKFTYKLIKDMKKNPLIIDMGKYTFKYVLFDDFIKNYIYIWQ